MFKWKLVKFLCLFWNNKFIPPNFVSFFSFTKDNYPVLFSPNNIYFSQNESEFFLDFLVFKSKFVKFLMPISKRQVGSFPNFASLFSFMKDNFSVFFSSNNIYFAQKEPIKVNFFLDFRVFKSKFVKFLMPILKRQGDSSPNFASLFSFMKDNSSVLV